MRQHIIYNPDFINACSIPDPSAELLAMVKNLLTEENINQQSEVHRYTALHSAVIEKNPSIPLIKLLLEKGANVSIKDILNETALHKILHQVILDPTNCSVISVFKLLIENDKNCSVLKSIYKNRNSSSSFIRHRWKKNDLIRFIFTLQSLTIADISTFNREFTTFKNTLNPTENFSEQLFNQLINFAINPAVKSTLEAKRNAIYHPNINPHHLQNDLEGAIKNNNFCTLFSKTTTISNQSILIPDIDFENERTNGLKKFLSNT